jgi:SEC-C motif domain protein
MRSRYTAFVVGDRAHLERTWHPRTRPDAIRLDPGVEWTGLEIVTAREGAAEAIVEFRARWRDASGPGVLAERSAFVRRGGRWVYLDGEVGDAP